MGAMGKGDIPRSLGIPLGKNRGGRLEGSLDVWHLVGRYAEGRIEPPPNPYKMGSTALLKSLPGA